MNETEQYEPKSIWERAVVFFKSDLKTETEINQMERYFPQFISHEKKGNEFIIGVSTEAQVEWFTPIYKKPLEHALADAGEVGLSVKFVVDNTNRTNLNPSEDILHQEKDNTDIPKVLPITPIVQNSGISSAMPLDENYTFENFVKGPSNNFAHAIAKAVAKDPGGNTNNPFFIWGGSGLGKTHLMQAIGHDVLRNMSGKTVCYITSEEFLNEYINSLTNDTVSAFRARFRSIDLMLMDDVQFIVGKEKIQEEFFNTYKSLMAYGKQVVMTCDMPPQKLVGLEERLKTRFQQGIVIEIEQPGYETRMAILKFKARNYRHEIPECALSYIVENIRSSVRAMEGALNLVAQCLDLHP